jgi:hypothetical protein
MFVTQTSFLKREIVIRVNDCTFYRASIDAFDVTDCGFSKVSGQEASQGGQKTSNQAWRYLSQGYGFYPP